MSMTVRMGPRESRGFILGLRLPQIGWIMLAGMCAMGAINGWGPLIQGAEQLQSALRDPLVIAGHGLWVLAIAACLCLAVIPVRGRYMDEYALVAANFVWQIATRQNEFRGGPMRMRARGTASERLELPADLAHLRVIPYDVGPAGQIAVVHDPIQHTYVGVLQCEGSNFTVDGTIEQNARMAAWGDLLSETCSETSLIARIQVLERTETDHGESIARDFAVRGRDIDDGLAEDSDEWFAQDSYQELISSVAAIQQTHETYIAVAIDARKAASEIRLAGGGDEGAAAIMMRELEAIADGLRSAGVDVLGWCPPRGLGFVIRTAYDPGSRADIEQRGGGVTDLRGGATGLPSGVAPEAAGPMAAENHWGHYVTDSAVHRTWWISQWPRRPVAGGGFLRPLMLETSCRRTVSVVLEPMPTARAQRRVERKQTKVQSDTGLRARLKRSMSRREEREGDEVSRREEELVDGHGQLRFIGYISTSAESLEELERQSREIETRAAKSQLEITRLYGEQDQAFGCAALPFGRGLR